MCVVHKRKPKNASVHKFEVAFFFTERNRNRNQNYLRDGEERRQVFDLWLFIYLVDVDLVSSFGSVSYVYQSSMLERITNASVKEPSWEVPLSIIAQWESVSWQEERRIHMIAQDSYVVRICYFYIWKKIYGEPNVGKQRGEEGFEFSESSFLIPHFKSQGFESNLSEIKLIQSILERKVFISIDDRYACLYDSLVHRHYSDLIS